MGTYETAYWLTDTWGMTRRESRSGAYHPYRPDCISHLELSLPSHAVSAVACAESAMRELNSSPGPLTDTEPLARLILRAEALASSRIEGLEMPAGRLLEYEALDELGIPHRVDGTEAAVMGNIIAMRDGVDRAAELPLLTVDALCAINARLLEGTVAAPYAGRLRGEQNWIGGSRVSPLGGAYVPPRPELVPELMEDLMDFCNNSCNRGGSDRARPDGDHPPVCRRKRPHGQSARSRYPPKKRRRTARRPAHFARTRYRPRALHRAPCLIPDHNRVGKPGIKRGDRFLGDVLL